MSQNEQWYNTEFGGEFWLAIATATFGFFGLALRACLKSKCQSVKVCFGLYECERLPQVDDDAKIRLEEGRSEINQGV
jgi:hypothetical protein